MDALIRSVRVSATRRRLGEEKIAPDSAKAREEAVRAAQDAWQKEAERRVRDECAAYAQTLYEQERELGYADGHREGTAAALAAASKEVEQVYERLRTTLDGALAAMEKAHAIALREFRNSVGEVTFEAVCRLAGRADIARASVLQVVDEVCSRQRNCVEITVRLHPRDVDVLAQLLKDHARLRGLSLSIVADDSLSLGGCLIEEPSGQYDGALESQLRRLHAILNGPAAGEAGAG